MKSRLTSCGRCLNARGHENGIIEPHAAYKRNLSIEVLPNNIISQTMYLEIITGLLVNIRTSNKFTTPSLVYNCYDEGALSLLQAMR